ncbi:MAG: class I SAM-dependent methyltransferase [Nitrospiraceae bacterium]
MTAIDPAKYVDAIYEVKRLDTLKQLIPAGGRKKAVDIGSGPGVITRILAERGWVVTSIDTEPQNLVRAKAWADQTIHGDANSVLPPYPPESFDLAVALEIIEHMPIEEGEQMLANIRRVLKPGGRLLLSTPNRYSLQGLKGYYWEEKIRRIGIWNAWDPTHIYIYSTPEIVRILRRQRFSIEHTVGYWYGKNGVLRLPFYACSLFPINYVGFNTIITCTKV